MFSDGSKVLDGSHRFHFRNTFAGRNQLQPLAGWPSRNGGIVRIDQHRYVRLRIDGLVHQDTSPVPDQIAEYRSGFLSGITSGKESTRWTSFFANFGGDIYRQINLHPTLMQIQNHQFMNRKTFLHRWLILAKGYLISRNESAQQDL